MPASTPPTALLDTAQDFSTLTGYIVPLDQYALLEVAGRDARAFLNNQLSNDFQSIPENRARAAGLCTPKGRLLCTLLGWRAPSKTSEVDSATAAEQPSILLLLACDLLSDISSTLSKFIFRSKVRFTDIASELACIGLVGENPAWTDLFPAHTGARYEVVHSEAGTLIHLGNVTASQQAEDTNSESKSGLPTRYLWILPQQDLPNRIEILAQQSTPLAPSIWDWLEIHAGEPKITAATQGLLVPQRANLDLLDALHFKKGCYPGQEVVARLQYRGVIRHRTLLVRTEKAYVGEEIFHQDGTLASSSDENPPQSCGIVLNVAPHPSLANTVDCLVMVPLATLEAGSLHIGSINGPTLQRLSLPYALPEETQATA